MSDGAQVVIMEIDVVYAPQKDDLLLMLWRRDQSSLRLCDPTLNSLDHEQTGPLLSATMDLAIAGGWHQT